MLFHSPEYLWLLLGCIAATLVVKHRFRWPFLLAASYVFYGAWRFEFVLLLLTSTLIDYTAGSWLGRLADGRGRLAVAWAAIAGNLGILIYFKYRVFLGGALGVLEPTTDLDFWRAQDFILPAGLSFYTLQSMGYTIDVYRRKVVPEQHLGYFALYVAFFPQLIAGPIERVGKLLPQLRQDRPFDWDMLRSGLLLFLFGLCKKMVIADNMAPPIANFYQEPSAAAGGDAIVLVLLSIVYILMDFSAYTDMARGSARMLGVDLSINFRCPLSAQNIRDFWNRWHITLSKWIFDYLYAPLARHSRNRAWRMASLFVTFTVIGLWHGPAWTFVFFGMFHGALSVLELQFGRIGWRWPEGSSWDQLRRARTYALVSLSTILFLAGTPQIALGVVQRLAEISLSDIMLPPVFLDTRFLLATILAIAAGRIHRLLETRALDAEILGWTTAKRWSLYYALILCVLIFGGVERQAFVYFQF